MLENIDNELQEIEKKISDLTNTIRLLESDEPPRRNSPRIEKLNKELRKLVERKAILIDES